MTITCFSTTDTECGFYFNIVTVINFLTSIINAIVLTVCYRKHKDFLSGIVSVTMETLTHPKETQALQ